ncbi:MAG TPA: RNA polymerase sigma-70 factor [Solirubrobacteraceae bacterium]|nr:RNA polymerase sigma-70 factor [Solirubrobacteraceae bacterium]
MPSADRYEDLRPLLFSIAYEMLGVVGDAEDIAQEAFLRLERAEQEGTRVESARAFLTTVTTRLAIDELRSARVRRERYLGPWLPEPLITDPAPSPAHAAETADSLSLSFLVLLETLSPIERAVFLLHEVFDYRYREIAGIVDKSEANCRQILGRARKRIDEGKPRFETDRAQQKELTKTFLDAFEHGDIDRLVTLLAPDVVFTGDGGSKGQGLPKPVYGRERVLRLLAAFATQGAAIGGRIVQTTINSRPGTLNLDRDGKLINVFSFEILGGQIQAIRSIINPEKLKHLGYQLSDIGRKREAAT